MNPRWIARLCFFVFICTSCERAGTNAPKQDIANTLPATDQELVALARKILSSQQSWTDPVKTDSVTKDSRTVALFTPPPAPDEEHTFRNLFNGNDFVVLIHRYGTKWKAWAIVYDGETETATFEGGSLQDCLEVVRKTFVLKRPFERI